MTFHQYIQPSISMCQSLLCTLMARRTSIWLQLSRQSMEALVRILPSHKAARMRCIYWLLCTGWLTACHTVWCPGPFMFPSLQLADCCKPEWRRSLRQEIIRLPTAETLGEVGQAVARLANTADMASETDWKGFSLLHVCTLWNCKNTIICRPCGQEGLGQRPALYDKPCFIKPFLF